MTVTARDLKLLAEKMDAVFVRFKIADTFVDKTSNEFDDAFDEFINHLIHLLKVRKSGLSFEAALTDIGEHGFHEIERAIKRQEKVWNIIELLHVQEHYVPLMDQYFNQIQGSLEMEEAELLVQFYHKFRAGLHTFNNHLPNLKQNVLIKEQLLNKVREDFSIRTIGELSMTQNTYKMDVAQLNKELQPAFSDLEGTFKNLIRGMGKAKIRTKQLAHHTIHSKPYELSVAFAFMTFLFLVKLMALGGLVLGAVAIFLKIAHTIHSYHTFKEFGFTKKFTSIFSKLPKPKVVIQSPISTLMEPILRVLESDEQEAMSFQPSMSFA
ncbi:MAG: hypothetical protein KC535_06100 [Nanoarchaeota archaeon]|nr:hypothetical protein [Nanoarchaeota archaeon]